MSWIGRRAKETYTCEIYAICTGLTFRLFSMLTVFVATNKTYHNKKKYVARLLMRNLGNIGREHKEHGER